MNKEDLDKRVNELFRIHYFRAFDRYIAPEDQDDPQRFFAAAEANKEALMADVLKAVYVDIRKEIDIPPAEWLPYIQDRLKRGDLLSSSTQASPRPAKSRRLRLRLHHGIVISGAPVCSMVAWSLWSPMMMVASFRTSLPDHREWPSYGFIWENMWTICMVAGLLFGVLMAILLLASPVEQRSRLRVWPSRSNFPGPHSRAEIGVGFRVATLAVIAGAIVGWLVIPLLDAPVGFVHVQMPARAMRCGLAFAMASILAQIISIESLRLLLIWIRRRAGDPYTSGTFFEIMAELDHDDW